VNIVGNTATVRIGLMGGTRCLGMEKFD